MIIGSNSFRWMQWHQARSLNIEDAAQLDAVLGSLARIGIQSWEPIGISSDSVAASYKTLLAKHGLQMRSMYVNCRLHGPDWRTAVEQVLIEARRGIALGSSIICTNPEPVQWGSPDNKTDVELRTQLQALRMLTEALRLEGAQLAYHVHDPELRLGAREFHHMMLHTRDIGMGFCFDPHWIYRGCGNSQLAVDDVLHLYGDRIVSLHIRQSRHGVWTESLCDGDLDYRPLAAFLRKTGFAGVIDVEHGWETGTPETMPLEDAHRISVDWLRTAFEIA